MNFLYSLPLLLGLLIILLIYYSQLNQDANIGNRIYTDDSYAFSFGEGIDTFMLKGKYFLNKKKLPLESGFNLDDFTVLICKEVKTNEYIFQVKKEDVKILTDKRGQNSPLPVDYYLYFKLIIDSSNQEIQIYSHLFSNNFDRDWRKKFAGELYKYLQE